MGNYKIDIKTYADNLRAFIKDPISISKDFIVEYVYTILHDMAKLTIQDTNQARYLLIHKFADKYGFTYEDLNTHYYNFWGNAEREDRGWGNNSDMAQMSETQTNSTYSMKQTIEDDGLYNQNYGLENYPSKIHAENTGRDNSKYMKRHITYMIDKANAGDLEDMNKLTDILTRDIEMFLFTGKR